MTPTLFGIGWLAVKAGMVVGTSIGLIAGLQKHHDFKMVKKAPSAPKNLRTKRGVDQNVGTGEDAIEAIEKLRPIHTAK